PRPGPYTRPRKADSSSWRIVTSNPTAARRAWIICSSAASPLPTVRSSNRGCSPASRCRADSGAKGSRGTETYPGTPEGRGPAAPDAEHGWEVGIHREHPTAVCLVGNEAKRAIADRARVPGGRPELRVGNVVQQVSRQDREIGEDVWNMIGGRRRPEPQLYR